MNTKYLTMLVLIFGLLLAFAHGGRISKRDVYGSEENDDGDEGNNGEDNGDGVDFDNGGDNDDGEATDEERAIRAFLEDGDEASQFLDRSSRLFYNQKSHMKEAKKKYEEKCEGHLHPRRCPDLATWPAWNQAFASATRKK